MAVLDEMIVTAPDRTTADLTIDDIKQSIARQFWGWYAENSEDVLVRRKVFLWSVSIRVRDLRPLFVTLFGDPK